MDLGKLNLPDMKLNERIVKIAWHHWFVLAKDIFGLIVLFFLPFFLIPIALSLIATGGIEPGGAPANYIFFFSSFWALIIWNILFTRWTDWYYDVWIITNWRIIDIDQQGLFKRTVTSILNLDHIQDIDVEIHGIIRTILDFGRIEVQTAGTKREFFFPDVAKPKEVERLIREAQAEFFRIEQEEGLTSGLK